MSGCKGFFGKVGLVVATSVTTAALAGTGVAVAATVIPNNSVTSPKIVNNSVKSADIRNNSVHSIDITDNNVTSSDLANESVTTFDLADGTVASEDIADATVTSTDIQNGSVAAADLASTVLPRWAKIGTDSGGTTLIRGRGVVGAERAAAGQYTVTFLQPIDTCGWTATINDDDFGVAPPLYTSVERNAELDHNTLRVRTFDATGAAVDPTGADGFTVTVTC